MTGKARVANGTTNGSTARMAGCTRELKSF